MEADCGISQFCSDRPGFSCILKKRYQDFIVHEIDNRDCIVKLTNLTSPDDCRDSDCHTWPVEVNVEDRQRLAALIADSDGTEGMSKECRTKIHKAIRAVFSGQLESRHEMDGTKCWIRVSKSQAKGTKESRKRCYWPPERGGDYCRFTLYKENRDTVNAVAVLARLLGVKSKDFQFAGNKDKRAVTSQRMSGYRIAASRLAGLNDKLIGMKVGNFVYAKDHLRLGDLNGNRFTVILRSISGKEEYLSDQVKLWSQSPFINYFGTQRFGTTEVATWEVGRALLKEDYEKAVDLLLQPRDGGDSKKIVLHIIPFAMRRRHRHGGLGAKNVGVVIGESHLEILEKCHKIWSEEKDPVKALAELPGSKKHTCLEGMILRQLAKNPRNYSAAVDALPRNSRTLYLHSYQSLLWNRIVSCRVALLGDKILVGDLTATETNEKKPRFIQAEELSQFTLYDIKMPVPGFDIMLPQNEARIWYDEILNEEGLTLSSFKPKKRDLWLFGSYRTVFERTTDVSFEFLRYGDVTEPLVSTDLEEMNSEKTSNDSCEVGSQLALKLEFSLPSSTYGTVALRELTKVKPLKMIYSCGFPTQIVRLTSPLGVLYVEGCKNGLHSLHMDKNITDDNFAPAPEKPIDILDGEKINGAFSAILAAKRWLEVYFAKDHVKLQRVAVPKICFLEPTDDRKTTFSVRSLRKLLETVSYGQTISYEELGLRCGSKFSSRAVGQAMKKNPVMLIIPCHRVVMKNGHLGSYSGGSCNTVKRWLIDHEQQ